MEIRQLLTSFERASTDDVGMALLDALKNSKRAHGLRSEMLKPIFAKFAKPVQDAAAEWLAQLSPNSAAQAAHLDELLKKLPPETPSADTSFFTARKPLARPATPPAISAERSARI